MVQIVEKALKKLNPPKEYTIDRGQAHKYRVKDLVVTKGDGEVDVSPMFKKVCEWQDKLHWLPKRVAKKLDDGPRKASIGFKQKKKWYPRFQ